MTVLIVRLLRSHRQIVIALRCQRAKSFSEKTFFSKSNIELDLVSVFLFMFIWRVFLVCLSKINRQKTPNFANPGQFFIRALKNKISNKQYIQARDVCPTEEDLHSGARRESSGAHSGLVSRILSKRRHARRTTRLVLQVIFYVTVMLEEITTTCIVVSALNVTQFIIRLSIVLE